VNAKPIQKLCKKHIPYTSPTNTNKYLTHYPGIHKFSKNVGATSKFWVTEQLHEEGIKLRIQKYQATVYKI